MTAATPIVAQSSPRPPAQDRRPHGAPGRKSPEKAGTEPISGGRTWAHAGSRRGDTDRTVSGNCCADGRKRHRSEFPPTGGTTNRVLHPTITPFPRTIIAAGEGAGFLTGWSPRS